jgi:hypothetical protein
MFKKPPPPVRGKPSIFKHSKHQRSKKQPEHPLALAFQESTSKYRSYVSKTATETIDSTREQLLQRLAAGPSDAKPEEQEGFSSSLPDEEQPTVSKPVNPEVAMDQIRIAAQMLTRPLAKEKLLVTRKGESTSQYVLLGHQIAELVDLVERSKTEMNALFEEREAIEAEMEGFVESYQQRGNGFGRSPKPSYDSVIQPTPINPSVPSADSAAMHEEFDKTRARIEELGKETLKWFEKEEHALKRKQAEMTKAYMRLMVEEEEEEEEEGEN